MLHVFLALEEPYDETAWIREAFECGSAAQLPPDATACWPATHWMRSTLRPLHLTVPSAGRRLQLERSDDVAVSQDDSGVIVAGTGVASAERRIRIGRDEERSRA
jgi:hypothetical protein